MNRTTLTAILFLLTVFASTPLHCTIGRSGHTYEYPFPGEVLPINGKILISADGCAVEHAARMKEYQPVLQGANESVELAVREAVDFAPGSKRLKLFLVPVRELKPNSLYRLRMLNPPAMDDCLKDASTIWNMLADIDEYESEPLSWTTSSEADHSAPIWKAPPTVTWAGSADTYPKPEGTRINIDTPVNSDGALAIAEITSGPDFSAEILDLIYTGKIEIFCGCDYCDIRKCFPGEKYRVWITAMDLAGNEARAPRVVEFRIPDPPQPRRYELDIKISPRIDTISGMEIKTSEPGLKANIEGVIELLAIVNPDGTAQDVQVPKGLPLGISTLAAESAKKWVFVAQEGASLRKVTITIKYKVFDPPYEPNWAP